MESPLSRTLPSTMQTKRFESSTVQMPRVNPSPYLLTSNIPVDLGPHQPPGHLEPEEESSREEDRDLVEEQEWTEREEEGVEVNGLPDNLDARKKI